MEIILNQDFPSLGYVGDKVKVKPGYARNFLIPRGIGIEASGRNEKRLKHQLSGVTAKKTRLRAEAETVQQKLEALVLEFTVRVGAHGKSFGSITAKDIEVALQKHEVVLDRRQIRLFEPIKKAGEHKVNVKLHSEVTAAVNVKVHSELPEKQKKTGAEAEGKAGKKRGGKGRRSKEEDAPEEADLETAAAAEPEQQE